MNRSDNQELQIQRCVDGEMSRGEQREFLRSLEHDPEAWRQLALTYVETQWLDADMSRLAFGHDEAPAESSDCATTTSGVAVSSAHRQQAAAPNHRASVPAAHHELKTPWKTVALAIACAALAITVGYQAGVRHEPDSARPGSLLTRGETPLPLPDGSRSNPPDSNAGNAGTVRARPVMHLQIPAGPERSEQLEVPVFEFADFNSESVTGEGSDLIPELQGLLNLSGYEIDRSRQLIHYQLDDGRQIAVPIETVQIRSRSL